MIKYRDGFQAVSDFWMVIHQLLRPVMDFLHVPFLFLDVFGLHGDAVRYEEVLTVVTSDSHIGLESCCPIG